MIRFKDPDGIESAGPPLQRAHAEALVRAFRVLYTQPEFGLDVPPTFLDARLPTPPPAANAERDRSNY